MSASPTGHALKGCERRAAQEEKEKADALKRKGKKVRELKVESDDLTAGLEGDHYDDDYADDFM